MAIEFVDPPTFVSAGAAGYLVLQVFKKWGDKLNPKNSPVMDRVIDVMTALSAASVVAGLADTPLISSLRAVVKRLFELVGTQLGAAFSIGANIVTMVLVLGAIYFMFRRFERTETWKDLLLFGLVVVVGTAIAPWIGTAMVWWKNHAVVLLWNVVMEALKIIFNLHVS